jgi:hypothetical protein
MFVKIEGSYINLALVHSIDLDDDGTATLWFTGADGACRDVTADDLKIIEAAIRHESVIEEIEQPAVASHSVVDVCKAMGLPVSPAAKEA